MSLKVDKNGNGNCYTCMGCRSFLTPYVDEDGNPKYYGRFNQGVVTINLVDVACSACREGKDEEKFWKILDERLELCHRALQCRHERLEGTLSDAAPILWQYGALARLKKGEPINQIAPRGIFHHIFGLCGALGVRLRGDGQEAHRARGRGVRCSGLCRLSMTPAQSGRQPRT